MTNRVILDYFNSKSVELVKRYDSYDSAELHQNWLKKVSLKNKSVLEVGCGSGRDAIFFSHDARSVTAVDFSSEMISHAKNKNGFGKVCWFVDELPDLSKLVGRSFDVIIAIAVLMFLTEEEQIVALKRFRQLLNNNGVVIFSVKQDETDSFCNTFASEFIVEAQNIGFKIETLDGGPDHNGRKGIYWQQFILRLSKDL